MYIDKEGLRKIAKQTVEISERGFYVFEGKEVKVSSKIEPSFWTEEMVQGRLDRTSLCVPSVKCEISSTVNSIINNYSEGIGVLNFASASKPGGGFLNGSMAQEESIAYASNLYYTIKDNYFYDYMRKFKAPIYTTAAIVSENVLFRDAAHKLLRSPKYFRTITCPAVNQRGISYDVDPSIMKNRMRFILDLATHYKIRTLILGAYGCGVFRNNPEIISKLWYDLLHEDFYLDNFKAVIFAIIDKKTYDIFKINI